MISTAAVINYYARQGVTGVNEEFSGRSEDFFSC